MAVSGMDFHGSAAVEMPNDNMRPLHWVNLDPQRIHILRQFHTDNPLAARCRNYVLDHIFSSNFSVWDAKGNEVNFDPKFDKFIQRRYREFCYDAYDAYMTMGIIPVVLVPHELHHYYPAVPKYGTYVIQVAYAIDTESMYYRILRPSWLKIYTSDRHNESAVGEITRDMNVSGARLLSYTATVDSSALGGIGNGVLLGANQLPGQTGGNGWVIDESMSVLTGLGSDPGLKGEINSPLASILPEVNLTGVLCHYMLCAEHVMTNPIMMTQFHKTEDPDDLSEYNAIMGGMNYDPKNFTVEKKSANLLSADLQRVRAFMTERVKASLELSAPEKDHQNIGHPDFGVASNTITIPKGLEYVKNDSNVTQAGDKFLSQKAILDDQIAGLYGIPLPLLRNVGALRGNIAGQNEIFRNTLIKYARMLGDISSVAFDNAYTRMSADDRDMIFGRKPIVDDSQFVTYGIEAARKQGMEVIERDKSGITPSLDDVIVSTNTQGGEAKTPTTKCETSPSSKAETAAASSNFEPKPASKDKTKPVPKSKRGRAGVANNMSVADCGEQSFILKLDVSHLMNDKVLQHLFNIGAIELHTYQNMMLNRVGFSSFQFKRAPDTSTKILADILRDPASEVPREDSTLPEGVGLESLGGSKRRVVPPGLLLELARHGGDVDKMEAARRIHESEVRTAAREDAGTAKKRKRSRDGVDRKDDGDAMQTKKIVKEKDSDQPKKKPKK